ncbi:MAG TPA: DoxX family protein [Flavobacterium sp.]|uniref:DoxX family protein n=1 Tax=unclassified Flavobacterium TaxID=196869 RepID=UPI0025C1D49E|nr:MULTISPECIES: DoxX family protein [unclassified Flavobacterium]HRE76831.1 DoxX family protein [Flavobacterium sp.]
MIKRYFTNSTNLLRIIVGITMMSHGIARLFYASIYAFGNFLESNGLLYGFYLAWIITLLDLFFGILLIFNTCIKHASYWFIFILLMGIALVHRHHGWFVVGHGSNGIEYSIVLISCFYTLLTINKNHESKKLTADR